MNEQEIRTLEMFKRVRGFATTHTDSFAAGGLGRELFDAVGQAIEELEGHAAAETVAGGSQRQNTVGKAAARESLRQKLEAIRRTARSMAFTTPGMEDKFRIPRGGTDQALINTARAFAQEAPALKAEFIRHEMPANFIEDLNASIGQMEEAIRDQNASKGAHKAAVVAIDEAMNRGIEAVRRLDSVIRNKFGAQPTVLAEWESARHTQRAPRSQTGAGNNPETAVGGAANTQAPTP